MNFKKISKTTLNVLFWLMTGALAVFAVMILIYGNDLPDYKKLATYAPPVASRLYASDGSLIIEYADERRVFIDFVDLPVDMVNAFIAAEDQNFWTHPGIDVQGILRAITNNTMRSLGSSADFSGASTITQQVAKNFFLTSDRTMSRKIREAILALKLERSFSKQHILTLYMNHIFLGARAYGVGSAALMYFNKPVSELTLAECAFLAALPKAPNNIDQAVNRVQYVLTRMVDEKFITQDQADAAMMETLNINSGFTAQMQDEYQYFAEDVRRQLVNEIGRDALYNQGLYIKTTINPELQKAASNALNKTLDAFNANYLSRQSIVYDEMGNEIKPELLQGAIIVMNPHTGRVLAMSGGRSFVESSFNRATQAKRQIGSTIKPFVYLHALENGLNPQSLLIDEPVVSLKWDDSLWKPENYDKKFLGLVPFRLSLETSRNVPTVRLVDDFGVRESIESVQRFGVYPPDLKDINLSLALGSGETTLEKLVLGYSALANGGYLVESKLVDYIEDRYGNLVGDKAVDDYVAWHPDLLPPVSYEELTPLSDPQSLYQMVSILQGAVERGTGKQARVPGQTIAGKTGTTNDVKDVWFVGFSKDLIAGVYLGFDTPKPMGQNAGSHLAAGIFADFMKVALDGKPNQPFAVPDGLTIIRVNRSSGAAASQDPNGLIISEVFKDGQKPNRPRVKNQTTQTAVVGGIF